MTGRHRAAAHSGTGDASQNLGPRESEMKGPLRYFPRLGGARFGASLVTPGRHYRVAVHRVHALEPGPLLPQVREQSGVFPRVGVVGLLDNHVTQIPVHRDCPAVEESFVSEQAIRQPFV